MVGRNFIFYYFKIMGKLGKIVKAECELNVKTRFIFKGFESSKMDS